MALDMVALFAFGSLAKNTLKPLSDLDFGILLNSRLRKKQRFENIRTLSANSLIYSTPMKSTR
jgi:UTP:GlnB (protein PII) uridylyltransferase